MQTSCRRTVSDVGDDVVDDSEVGDRGTRTAVIR